jgi:uncharacterized membrane protein YphA (DoxX/SURF4 family)
MQKLSLFILRVGIGAVIIWFALQQLSNPSSWVFYLPDFTKNLPVSQIGFIYLNVWFELTFGTLMIVGFYTRIVAFFLALHMLGIVYTIGYNETGVRDFGLSIALISISLYGASGWSLDEFFEKNKQKDNVILKNNTN